MKKALLYFIFLVFFSVAARAQSTLQFSQVLLLSNATAYTVPSGRIWKVVGMTATVSSNSGPLMSATINGATNYFAIYNTNNNLPVMLSNGNIFWLPSGTTITPTNNIKLISVIEFITSP